MVLSRIPSQLAANCRKTPERAEWLRRLPSLLQQLLQAWSLALDAPLDSAEMTCSYVAPVICADGTRTVLKIGMPQMEGEHEIQGLRFWDGDPTVRLLMADDALGALLLERCEPGTTLRALPEPQQDVVVSGLLRRLWRSPSPQHSFRPLSALTKHWSDQTLAHIDQWLDPGLVREGLHSLAELPRAAPAQFVLATDLHAGNVLRAQRQPWLVIDPKPFVGDPAYDATQHLFNCSTRLRSYPDRTIRDFANLLGVDHQRVKLWTFARAAAEPRDDWTSVDSLTLARILAP